MNYLRNPQCAFCADMNQYVNLNQQNPHFCQLRSYSNYQDQQLLYSYDMTQRSMQDNYITYCNVVNNFSGNNEPQYVQVIDSGASYGRVQYYPSFNNESSLPFNQSNTRTKLVFDRNENSRGTILCTCNDFINSNLQNKISSNSLPNRNIGQFDSRALYQVPRLSVNRDSIYSCDKSTDDQPDNSLYSNGSVLSDPMCRFCHLSKNTQADQLISPCFCSGTLKYVHQNCLKTWLDVSKKQRETSKNKAPHCELCNFKYVRKRKFQFGKIRQPKLSQNDCALHLIFLCSLLVMVTSASVTILCFAMEKSGSKSGRIHVVDKASPSLSSSSSSSSSSLLESSLKFSDKKSASLAAAEAAADLSKTRHILCEYLLHLKNSSHVFRQPVSKLSVICDAMLDKDRKSNRFVPDAADLFLLAEDSAALSKLTTTSNSRSSEGEKGHRNIGDRGSGSSDSGRGKVGQSGGKSEENIGEGSGSSENGGRRGEESGGGRSGRGGGLSGKGSPGSGNSGSWMWLLSPEEAVTLASGVIFFIAFFIAMMVQVKSNYTCYQLVMYWIRLNYVHEVQSIPHPLKKCPDMELKQITAGSCSKPVSIPREYIERCITEI